MFTQKDMINLDNSNLTVRTREQVRALGHCKGCEHECQLLFEEIRTMRYPDGFVRAYYPKIGSVVIRDYLDKKGNVRYVYPDYDAMVACDKAREICALCDNYVSRKNNQKGK